MREKVFSMAKGNFIYESPKLILTPEKLVFDVCAGEKKTVDFVLENERGSIMKGFGATDDSRVEFLPVFRAEKNELHMVFDATVLSEGTTVKGQLYLVTDCGEAVLSYEANIIAPAIRDDKGIIRDYAQLRRRIEDDSEKAATIFQNPAFPECFLYRDEAGRILYRHLVRKNSKRQGMEEFLVAMGKKDPIRLSLRHMASGSRKEVVYKLHGTDIQDSLVLRINTWGSVGIRVTATADFIVPEVEGLRTDDFEGKSYELSYTIVADRVKGSRKKGSLIISTPYEQKEFKIAASDVTDGHLRQNKREEKKNILLFYRTVLSYIEGKIDGTELKEFIWEKRELAESVFRGYELSLSGFLNVLHKNEEEILEFYREAERLEVPGAGAESREVENYIIVQYIKYLLNGREEDREDVRHLLSVYEGEGYSGLAFFLLHLRLDERYRTWKWKEEDIKAQIERGSDSPFLYSELARLYMKDASFLSSLDLSTRKALKYGARHNLMTKEIAMAVSVLTERTTEWNPLVFSLLEQLYEKYQLPDTLRSICAMLIRSDKREHRYFRWFDYGVQARLRMTELFEYYMYTLDYHATFRLPDAVLSYFQYENHLNDRCKAFLYSYIVKKKGDWPDIYKMYEDNIWAFAVRQLTHHRLTEEIAVLYEELFSRSTMENPPFPLEQLAKDLATVLFGHMLICANPWIDSVVVVHLQTKEEILYQLENGRAVIQLYTPDYQLYFVDRDGHYLSGTIDYSLKKMLNLDSLAAWCRENGSDYVHLLVHLAAKAMKGIRLSESQAAVLFRTVEIGCLREHMHQRVLFRLYEYYYEQHDMSQLPRILNRIAPEYMKPNKLGKIAEDCIYHGLYEKAYQILSRYGTKGCDKKALGVLVGQQLVTKENEFTPLLVKWSYELYREKFYDKDILNYLLQYYMGATSVLTSIYKKCVELNRDSIPDGSKERLLGQVLFTGTSPVGYEELFLNYYESGKNRMLVKAFLSYYAYEYLVDHCKELSESIFVRIEKDAFYLKEKIMVLAVLKKYSTDNHFAKKQREFIEKNLEECAVSGLILDFMKNFIGKVTVPYEIENHTLIQHYSGTVKEVFLHVLEGNGKKSVIPMKKVFDGIYTQQVLLFVGEEKEYFIEEEENGYQTEKRVMRQQRKKVSSEGLFQMVNQMIALHEEYEKTGNESVKNQYQELRRKYEKDRAVAGKLFSIEE